MTGPYETEREAIGAARHILDSPPATGAWQDGSLRLLEGACGGAGVKLGAYDHQILLWLAGWEPQVCAVIAGLIARAHSSGPPPAVALDDDQAATVTAALDDAVAGIRDRAAHCGECEMSPAGLCDGCSDRLARLELYAELAARIGGA